MTTKDEALKQALDALEGMAADIGKFPNEVPAIAACREALAQKDCDCFAIALDAANRTKEACINATGKKKNIEAYVNAIQIAHNAAGTDFDTLAQTGEQEPVAWRFKESPDESRSAWHYVAKKKSVPHGFPYQPLYTAPPKSQPLTDEGINEIADSMPGGLAGFMKGWGWQQFARAIEAAHGIGAEHDAR